jgi:hypothetical protein
MGDARRAMELSRERMYAERSKRNRTIMLYTTGSVSPLSLGHERILDRALDQCSLHDAEGLRRVLKGEKILDRRTHSRGSGRIDWDMKLGTSKMLRDRC